MLYYMPAAGKLKLQYPRFPFSSSSTNDPAFPKLIHLLNSIKAAVRAVFLLFPLASLVSGVLCDSAAKVTVIPVSRSYFWEV